MKVLARKHSQLQLRVCFIVRILFCVILGLRSPFPRRESTGRPHSVSRGHTHSLYVVPSISRAKIRESSILNPYHTSNLSIFFSFSPLDLFKGFVWLNQAHPDNFSIWSSTDFGANCICKISFSAVPQLLFHWITRRWCVYTRDWESCELS